MNRVNIDLEGLIAAIETRLPHIENYLHIPSGEVVTVVNRPDRPNTQELDEIARDNLLLSAKVKAEPDAYAPVPHVAPDLAFRWMQEWSSTVADETLRTGLLSVLQTCEDECFEKFRNAIGSAPESERERWFAFREEKLTEFVLEWVDGLVVESETANSAG
jgi:Uncharacterised protein family (UPF0158)